MYLGVLLWGIQQVPAQTPADAIMMEKGEICLAILYDHGYWEQYWEGALLRRNGNMGTLIRQTVSPMAAVGLANKLNLIVMTPYVKTRSSEPNGGQLAGVQGFQDLGLFLKAEVVNREIGKGKLTFHPTLGFSTPMSNYLSDYMPYSLGFGANEFSARGILQYQLHKGLYVRGSVAHLWRGYTEAERDYYYSNGSYYTAWMNVPNAWNYQATIGMWLLDNSLRLETSFNGLKCTSGDDIRAYNAPQPTNKVEVDQLSFFGQYYFQKNKGLGVLASYTQMFNGRNMGKFSNIGFGLTYQFSVLKKSKKQS